MASTTATTILPIKGALSAAGIGAYEAATGAAGKMPDVVLYYPEKKWLLLVEPVTSHVPVDGKRHAELANRFLGPYNEKAAAS